MSIPKLKYLSMGSTVDGTNYCSGVETLAENIIEDNETDATLVFPSRSGWANMRSESYRMTTDNAEALLPLPIYKIRKFLLKINDLNVEFKVQSDFAFASLSSFVDKNGNSFPLELDITELIFTTDGWNALPLAKSTIDYRKNIRKDNTLYWGKNSTKIPILGTVYTKGTTILGGIFADNTPTYERLISYILYQKGDKYFLAGATLRELMTDDITLLSDIDVRNWQYRIEYVPISSKTKIRARKSEKQFVEYLQPFNQRAEINAASAFGKNMWLTAQKTGNPQITIVKNYTKLADIPPLGALVRHNGKRYRLIANSYTMTNTVYIQVAHTLSENWSSKSKHVAVNQKYRNYNIPQDMLWRNMYWEDYITVSGERKIVSNDSVIANVIYKAMQLFYVGSTNDNTIDSFCWLFDGKTYKEDEYSTVKQTGVIVPCSSYGVANSIVLSASFKDNLSAGLRTSIDEKNLCEESLYCDEDGTLEKATVIFSDGFDTIINDDIGAVDREDSIETAQRVYPSIFAQTVKSYTSPDNYLTATIKYNAPKTPVFERTFHVDKDPGEAIKFTYQVHFVAEGDCVVGNKIAEHNPLIKRYEKSDTARSFKVWLLNNYIREGEDKIQPTETDLSFTHTRNGQCFTVHRSSGVADVYISLGSNEMEALKDYKAWAITDENNNLYVGRNENQEGIVYLCISHNRP